MREHPRPPSCSTQVRRPRSLAKGNNSGWNRVPSTDTPRASGFRLHSPSSTSAPVVDRRFDDASFAWPSTTALTGGPFRSARRPPSDDVWYPPPSERRRSVLPVSAILFSMLADSRSATFRHRVCPRALVCATRKTSSMRFFYPQRHPREIHRYPQPMHKRNDTSWLCIARRPCGARSEARFRVIIRGNVYHLKGLPRSV